jgi:hypothetical protein
LLPVQDVAFPYTTCKTTFYGQEAGQAVFATIVNDTEVGNAKALCVVRAPFQEDQNPSLDAQIEVLQALGPSAEPLRVTSFHVRFSQPPVVASGNVQYASGQTFGSVTVKITHIDGVLKVR